jgi:hypothetical protein
MHQPENKNKFLVSDFGGRTQWLDLELSPDGSFKSSDSLSKGVYELYYYSRTGAVFNLGTFLIDGQVFSKKNVDRDFMYSIAVEGSAIVRVGNILRFSSGLLVSVVSSGNISVSLKTESNIEHDLASFFVCRSDTRLTLKNGDELLCRFEIMNLSFEIETVVEETDDFHVALSLPSSGRRLFRRHVPRFLADIRVRISNQSGEFFSVDPVDFSQLGMRICKNAFTSEICLWEELSLELKSDRVDLKVLAIVVSIDDLGIGLVFSSGNEVKRLFYFLSSYQLPNNFNLCENAELTWECLDQTGYLKLLSEGALQSVKTECIEAWRLGEAEVGSLQPIICSGLEPVGTISSVKVEENHWVPHSLGTKTKIDSIDVTAFLYSSWPIYQLMDSQPSWFSTYYDVNKKWHNRFYQVFLDEQKSQAGILTFVRNWYWCALTTEYKSKFRQIGIKDDPKLREKARRLWDERYKLVGNSPIVEFKESKFADFEHLMEATVLNGEIVAIAKVIRSPLNHNPFSVFNAVHINIFDKQISKNQEIVMDIVRTVLANQHRLGIKATAVTLDYDVKIDSEKIQNLHFFCSAKCLSATSAHIPSLISNNALCFEEIKARYRA